jgi:DNA helicase-2/ATP-dependent DNA helicase PcrA
MRINKELFEARYNSLNEEQKQAVNTIYGPVMVIAGPGTGKTEVLSMRIANLLMSDAQVQPYEILCLTYTDEATNSMRRRLLQIIGPAAHRVNIVTFHAFCNNVIQNNSEYFSLRNLQPITDLERTDMLYEMLEQLPSGHPLRKLSGNIYYDAGRLQRLFDMMKREHYTAEDICSAADAYIEDLPNRKEFIYQRASGNFKKGDLKQHLIDEEKKRMETTKAAARLFNDFTERMNAAGRYDFNDMIIWVLDAFKKHPALLLSYQERNQYILVDEFQDTNGSQNELLNLLTEFWDDPNIFVVGDDDQSIYEFQGARIHNIIDFYQKYQNNIRVIVLPQNYRSSQAILDKATATIEKNQQRLIYQLQELNLNKNIVASAPRFKGGNDTVTPIVKVYNNILHEEADIILQIEELQRSNVALKDIAVLYAQHKQADNILALMERKGIPYNIKKQVNILDEPVIRQMLNILRYLDAEKKQPLSAESLLFEILHTPNYRINPTDIAKIALYIQSSKDKPQAYWRLIVTNDLLLETLELESVKQIRQLGKNISSWLVEQQSLPLPMLVEKMMYESGLIAYYSATKEYVWNIQVLHTFFEYVKELHDKSPGIKPADFLQIIDRMQAENISLPLQKVIQNEDGVFFYTAHGAKGNEFEHVFLIGCTKNFWEEKRGGSNEYSLPDTLTRTEQDTEKTYKTEVARRLFYVALTRAKKHLHVSYALTDNLGKPLTNSVFIDEISEATERIHATVEQEDLLKHLEWAMDPVPYVRIELTNHQHIDRVLQSFSLSATTLSKYLDCPVRFYYECVLKVPFLKNDALAFGSAIHYALERMFKQMKANNGTFPTKEEVINYFDSAMYKEMECFTPIQYDRRKEQGHTILTQYYDRYISTFEKNVEVELYIKAYLGNVPVSGKIDKIEFLDNGTCNIIDYKTGDPDKSTRSYTLPPDEKQPNGGDYWRQMVFYKMLLDVHSDRSYRVAAGIFDYIEPGKSTNEFKRFQVPVFLNDETTVMQQLKNSYASIMNHEFDKGCGEEDCYWCNFAKDYKLVRPAEADINTTTAIL